MAFFAAAVALEIASGTSRALPWPKPARPLPSPTTTSAAKPKRLPPFTVLETRLMWTRFSISSSPPSSSPPRPRPRSSRPRPASQAGPRRLQAWCSLRPSSELQPAFAGGIGQRLDAAMEQETAAIKHEGSHAGLLGRRGDVLADLHGGIDVGARALHAERRSGGHGAARGIVDDLRVDVATGAVDRQARLTAGAALER